MQVGFNVYPYLLLRFFVLKLCFLKHQGNKTMAVKSTLFREGKVVRYTFKGSKADKTLQTDSQDFGGAVKSNHNVSSLLRL